MPSIHKFEVVRDIVEEEIQRRGGCVSCGHLTEDMLFVREPGYPDPKYNISQLVARGISKHRLLTALPFTSLWCRECFNRETGYGGKLFREGDHQYQSCAWSGCTRKARIGLYCKEHARENERREKYDAGETKDKEEV